MARVNRQYSTFIKKCRASGASLLRFPCPVCSIEIETLAAPKGAIWDTACTCPYCAAFFFKAVNDTTVLTQSIPGVTNGENHHHVN